jgi:hypothetical protein
MKMMKIKDEKNKVIRTFRSDDKPYEIPAVNIPLYWIRPQQILSAKAGSHRFLWDLHYTPMNTPPSYPIAAVYGNTAPESTSPWVMPGNYTAVLTVNGKSYTQTIKVKMDPRVTTSIADLQAQHDYSMICYNNSVKAASYKDASFDPIIGEYKRLMHVLQGADMTPTEQVINAVKRTTANFSNLEKSKTN